MKCFRIVSCVIFIALSLNLSATGELQRNFGFYFSKRYMFFNNEKWNNYIPNSQLPKLDGFLRFHGVKFYGEIDENWNTGFEAYGVFNDVYNNYGFTHFEGAYAAMLLNRQQHIFNNLCAFAEINLGCGIFSFNSLNFSGSGLNAFSGTVEFEPELGLFYDFKDIFQIGFSFSRMVNLLKGSDWNSPKPVNEIPVFPGNIIMSFSFGYKFPSLIKE